MKHIVSTCILVALFAIGHVANADDDDEGEFEAKLRGGNEVPAVETDTTGKAEVEFNDGETEAEIKLKVRKGVRVQQAHIHCAPEGENGPVVVFLAGLHERGWDVDGTWIKNETVTDYVFHVWLSSRYCEINQRYRTQDSSSER